MPTEPAPEDPFSPEMEALVARIGLGVRRHGLEDLVARAEEPQPPASVDDDVAGGKKLGE